MDYALVLISVFAIFIPALILPGPDFVAVVRSSMTRGTRAGLLTTLGVSMGLCLYATLSLLGLSAILAEYQWLTWTVRVLGGSYLIFLGIKLLRARPQVIELDRATRPAGKRTILRLSGDPDQSQGDRSVRQRLCDSRHRFDTALADGPDDRPCDGVVPGLVFLRQSLHVVRPRDAPLSEGQALDREGGGRLLHRSWRQGFSRRQEPHIAMTGD